jgi:hypothetical protein
MSQSIFSSATRARTPSAQNPRGYGPPSPPKSNPRPPSPHANTRDESLLALLEAPLHSGETAHAGFMRKESELRTAFAALTIIESRALHARLSNPRTGDPLAAAFMRLTIDRRVRLINFLAGARRREALASRTQGGQP